MSDDPRRNERCRHGIRWPHECKDCFYESELAPVAGSAVRASAARMEDALRQIEDIVGRCVRNPGLESNVVEMVTKLADKHDALITLLQQMLDVTENCDETGYADGVGFVDIDELHERVRAALSPNCGGEPHAPKT